MERSRAVIDRLAAGDDAHLRGEHRRRACWPTCASRANELDQLQRNVVRSHAAGVGEPLAREVVRAMMLIRANVLAKGFSGIRPLVAERLCELLNRGVTPWFLRRAAWAHPATWRRWRTWRWC